jgi:hypothetical protein
MAILELTAHPSSQPLGSGLEITERQAAGLEDALKNIARG